MENAITKAFEGHNVRILVENEAPIFHLGDVLKAVGSKSVPSNIKKNIDSTDLLTKKVSEPGGRGVKIATFISELALIELLGTLRTEKTKPFRRWVFREVIPTVLKTGGYSVEPKTPQTYVEALEALVETEKARLALEEKNRELEPKAEVHDKVLEPGSAIGFRQVCATLRDDYPQVLEPHVKELLREEGLIQKRSVASTAKARNAGYAIDVVAGNFGDKTRTTTRWTPKGLSYIIYLIESQGL